MRILFDSKNSKFKIPFGCINPQEECKINIHIPVHCKAESVFFHIFDDYGFVMQVPMNKSDIYENYEVFSCTFSLFNCGLYFYNFRVCGQTEFYLYKEGSGTNIGVGDNWQLTCTNKECANLNKYSGKVMYQIFPDRYAKAGEVNLNNKLLPYYIHEKLTDVPDFKPDSFGEVKNCDFYGGNLQGIITKIPYLKNLGVGIIYLNPIFYAYSNHRYDTADYKKIDPMLGTEADFALLCETAHKNGISIILDGVFSHTGSNSIYFDAENVFGTGVISNRESEYTDWFEFQEYPHTYTSWWGIKTLPCTNELAASYMDYIIYNEDSVIKHWLSLGADGFRLDVADELPDKFISELKKEMVSFKKDAFLIGEVWEDASNKISYGVRRKYFSHNILDSVMNYPLKNWILGFVKEEISPKEFAENVMTQVENYPPYVLNLLMNSLSTHDTPRVLTFLGAENMNISKDEQAVYKLPEEKMSKAINLEKIAALLQFTMPGIPCIYYGDEIGMEGFGDPFCRGYYCYEQGNKNLEQFYENLAKIKNEYVSLQKGTISFDCSDNDILSFTRTYKEETIKVVITKNEIMADNAIFSISTPRFNAFIELI